MLPLKSDELALYRDDLLVALKEGTILAEGRFVEDLYERPARKRIHPDDWDEIIYWEWSRIDLDDCRHWVDIVIPRPEFEKEFFANRQSTPPKPRVRSGPKAHGDWKGLLTEVILFVDELGQLPDTSSELKQFILSKTAELDDSTIGKYVRDLYARKVTR
jgi:hypothetical protein